MMKKTNSILKSIVWLALGTGLLLLIPFTAMQFSQEVDWTLSDFIIAGVLLFTTGLAYLLITRNSQDIMYRLATALTVGFGLFLIWSNLAVGIIGSEDNAINLAYFGVIIVGLAGSFIARFRPIGMFYTLAAMAGLQAVIAIIALISGKQHLPGSSVLEILAVNGFFIFLFTIPALLFWNISSKKPLQPESAE